MKLAYLVNTYPRASHSFIRREIQALERIALPVHRFAMRSDRGTLVDAGDIAEDQRTEHVLERGLVRLFGTALGWMVARPAATAAAFAQAWACGARGAGGPAGTGGRLRHLIYLVEAACIARRCCDLGITHLHAHFGTNSATVALLARGLGGPQFSFTVHGPEEFDAPLALSLGQKIEAAAFVVAISSFGRSQLCRWVAPRHWDKIKVVHCGIEPDRFPLPAALPTGGPHLVAVGRFSAQKGLDLLIEAMAIAAPALPDLHLTLVGDGELRDRITGQIDRFGLGPRFTLTGWQDEAGVRRALDGAQALILPSFAEGLPMVLMEAMANGRPVIATAIAGVPELVSSDTGWTVPAGDAKALAAALLTLSQVAPDRLAEMGRAARARVFARHDIDKSASLLAGHFREAGA
ncbi:glycosyltransferase [Tabrizicola oligotrophica]|uniref:Glycosyltransferase family 4 protein n=1 Tax=Tabrizicola oligotrophica TaxID=2710650 RepID=A0A6M0QS85_9RHOB|nr:glycosyltransferase [Tabrizicola oligotrophica]NEY89694.1 glycosyltransferase family 4 protein [Tabrizicola oligotrophica]